MARRRSRAFSRSPAFSRSVIPTSLATGSALIVHGDDAVVAAASGQENAVSADGQRAQRVDAVGLAAIDRR
ncbi:hypothetical protein [Jiangella asiatica]|uniref:Uncharacterized protein n=1 Tax=Jiangella asiatica TaxID=2530372 RepID=A0A4R5CTW9_9ACTN|nr:hypothetical protein [Jiangella asiatica]TDE01173.1 hypothetical protein E1269_23710 [Jiangella asiatica]